MAGGIEERRGPEEQDLDASLSPSAFHAGRSKSRCRRTGVEWLPSVGWLRAHSSTDNSNVPNTAGIIGINRRKRFAQGIFLHFSHRVARQFLDQEDSFRHFIAG